jgi:putative flippase GtrA
MKLQENSDVLIKPTWLMRRVWKPLKELGISNKSMINMYNKDKSLGLLSGLISGLLAMPVLKAANLDLYSSIGLFIVPVFIIGTMIYLTVFKYLSGWRPVIWQIGKFGSTGILNTFVDFGFLTLISFEVRYYYHVDSTAKIFDGVPIYSFFKTFSFTLAVVNSYYWNKYWTFSDEVYKKSTLDFIRFLLISIAGCGINVGVSTYFFSYMNLWNINIDQCGLFAAGLGSLFGLGWNFIGYKYIVFGKKVQ